MFTFNNILKYSALFIIIVVVAAGFYVITSNRFGSTFFEKPKLVAPVKKLLQKKEPAIQPAPISQGQTRKDRRMNAVRQKTIEARFRPQALALVLRGIINGGMENAQAIIEHTNRQVQDLYKIGDSVGGGILTDISKTAVVIRINDRDMTLTLATGSGSAEPDALNRTVSRSKLDTALKDVNQLIEQIDLKPYTFKDGSGGLVAEDIVPGSLFDEAGLKNGDIIREINGTGIENPSRLAALYKGLKLVPLDALSLDDAESKSKDVIMWLDDKAGGVVSEVSKVQQKIVSGEDIPVKIVRNGEEQTLTFSVK